MEGHIADFLYVQISQQHQKKVKHKYALLLNGGSNSLVSSLNHEATMVTTHVFMIARCTPLFEYSPMAALIVIIFVGAMTSLL